MAYSKSSSASDALLIRPVLMGAFVTTSSKNPNKKKRQIEFGKQNKNRRSWIIEWVVIGDADKWDKLMKLMNWVKTGSHGPQRYANELVSQVCQHLFLLLLGTAPRRREHRCLLSLSLSLSLSLGDSPPSINPSQLHLPWKSHLQRIPDNAQQSHTAPIKLETCEQRADEYSRFIPLILFIQLLSVMNDSWSIQRAIISTSV